MDLRPCACGEARFDRQSTVVALEDGDLAARYSGPCPACGRAREFTFRLPAELTLPPSGGFASSRQAANAPTSRGRVVRNSRSTCRGLCSRASATSARAPASANAVQTSQRLAPVLLHCHTAHLH